MKPDRQAIGSRAIEGLAQATPTPSVDARSAAEELNTAYALLASRCPDETFSRDLIAGGGFAGKLTVALFAALAAILIVLIARGTGAWV